MIRIVITVLIAATLLSCNFNSLWANDAVEQTCKDALSNDPNGPTVELSYGQGEDKINPVPDFMYFVPLISPTLVDARTSKDNNQLSKIISRDVKEGRGKFYVECEFQMWGTGTHQNTFDSEQMIKRNIKDLQGDKPLKNVLDYIKFDGEGYGIISAEGQMIDSKPVVTKVVVDFSSRRDKSPVTIGLYSINPVNGEYKYENHFGTIVARINTLTFEKTDGDNVPRMAIKLDSIARDDDSHGLWSSIKGRIANIFIDPISINPKGNETMLDFGLALYHGEKSYTFPIAENLTKD